MLYALLWIAGLAAAQLWSAFWLALSARIDGRLLRRPLQVLTLGPVLAASGALCYGAWYGHNKAFMLHDWLPPCAAWGGAWFVSVVLILAFGRQRRSWRVRRIAAGFGIAVVALALVVWAIDADVKKRLEPIAARAQAVLEADVAEVLARGENAAPCYEAAWEPLGDVDDWPTSSPSATRRFIADHADVFEKLRACEELPACVFVTKIEPEDCIQSGSEGLWRLVRFLKLRFLLAEDSAYAGAQDETLRHIESARRLSAQIGWGRDLVWMALARAVWTQEAKIAEIWLAHRPSGERPSSRWIRSEAPDHLAAYHRGTRAEMAQAQLFFATMLAGKPLEVFEDDAQNAFGGVAAWRLKLLGLRLTEGVDEVVAIEADLSTIEAACREDDLRATYQLLRDSGRAAPGTGRLRATTSVIQAVAFRRGVLDPLTYDRLVEVALAAQRCRDATGEYPESLADLVPAYLDAVPDDPFCNAPLRAAKHGDGLVVYSVGERGRDVEDEFEDSEDDAFDRSEER